MAESLRSLCLALEQLAGASTAISPSYPPFPLSTVSSGFDIDSFSSFLSFFLMYAFYRSEDPTQASCAAGQLCREAGSSDLLLLLIVR